MKRWLPFLVAGLFLLGLAAGVWQSRRVPVDALLSPDGELTPTGAVIWWFPNDREQKLETDDRAALQDLLTALKGMRARAVKRSDATPAHEGAYRVALLRPGSGQYDQEFMFVDDDTGLLYIGGRVYRLSAADRRQLAACLEAIVAQKG